MSTMPSWAGSKGTPLIVPGGGWLLTRPASFGGCVPFNAFSQESPTSSAATPLITHHLHGNGTVRISTAFTVGWSFPFLRTEEKARWGMSPRRHPTRRCHSASPPPGPNGGWSTAEKISLSENIPVPCALATDSVEQLALVQTPPMQSKRCWHSFQGRKFGEGGAWVGRRT